MKRLLLLLIICVLAFPAAAMASRDQESTFQDDNELVYTSSAQRKKNLDTLKSLGVDRIRVTVLWKAIAPSPNSRSRPLIDTTNPAAYGDARWRNYDELVIEAGKRDIGINFNLSGPSPLWANKRPPREDIADTYEPSQAEWAQFVAAVGQRFSGDFTREDGVIIPRVDYWSIWNEPNHSGWLTPTWQKSAAGFFPRSASLYRELLDNAYAALKATGHGADTILIGETAPSGNNSRNVKRFMKPLVFIRALYCLDDHLHRLKGARAERLDCPKTGKEMVTDHPALFDATGFAHHPYTSTKPDVSSTDHDAVNLAALNRLTRTLDKGLRQYGQRRKLPIYLTEFGYQTLPDPIGVSFADQAAFINQSEYIAWKNPRVQTVSQFLLVDDDDKNPASFQTGLILRKGHKKKASYNAYRLPLWIEGGGAGKKLFAVIRPAARGARVKADVQFRPSGGGSWRTIKTVRSRGAYNWVATFVNFPDAGSARISYDGNVSRTVAVSG